MVFLADALFRPLDGNLTVAGKGLDPLLVFGGALAQDFFAQRATPCTSRKKCTMFSGGEAAADGRE